MLLCTEDMCLWAVSDELRATIEAISYKLLYNTLPKHTSIIAKTLSMRYKAEAV